MNWLLILTVLIVSGNIVWGFCKGFLRVIYSMVAWLVILGFVTWATPHMTVWMAEHTTIDDRIESGCKDRIRELMEENKEEKERDEKLEDLAAKVPEAVFDKLADTTDDYLEKSGLYDSVALRASDMAMRAISFVIVLLATLTVFHIFAMTLDLVGKLPVIGEVNRFLGLLAGFVKGMLLVWLVFAFLAMGSGTSLGTQLIKLIYESKLLVWLYENNMVLSILMRFL